MCPAMQMKCQVCDAHSTVLADAHFLASLIAGAQLIPIGTGLGIDGLPTTTYQIGDAIVAQATGTVNVQQGASSIGCALGADGYATCSGLVGGVQPFAYTEPITYFGQTTGQAAPMPAPTGVSLDANGRQTMGANLESGYIPSEPRARKNTNTSLTLAVSCEFVFWYTQRGRTRLHRKRRS